MSNHRRLLPGALLLALFGSTAALSGCQTSCTGDARFDGYMCARSNLADGTYSAQTANLRQTAGNRMAEAASLRGRYQAAQARLRAARAAPSTSASDLLALENEVEALRRAVARGVG